MPRKILPSLKMKVQNFPYPPGMQAIGSHGHITHFTKPGKTQEMSLKTFKE